MTSMVMDPNVTRRSAEWAPRISHCSFGVNAIFHAYMRAAKPSHRMHGDIMAAEIRLFPCLSDNFGYLIHDPATKATASIDAPEAAPIIKALEREGWTLTDILITHHHHDHVGGVAELKQKYDCRVRRPARQVDQDRQCRSARRPGRRRQGRQPAGAGAGNPGPYARPCQLRLRQRQGAVRRRHAVLDRLRAGVRGQLSDDVGIAAQAARAARRFQTLLRP